jgi:hypothetical protein
MTHVVYLAMMLLHTGQPQQMSAERSMEACTAVINQQASVETGKNRRFWYCQPAIANITLGPQ